MHFAIGAILSFTFPTACVAALYEAFDRLPISNFDFIVVGGVALFFVCRETRTHLNFLQLGLRGA
jgi:hypothetical protein